MKLKSKGVGILLLAILTFNVLAAQSAAALNDYGVTLDSNLTIGGTINNIPCDETDMTSQWGNILSTNSANSWSYKNTWNYQSNHGDSRLRLDTFFNELNLKILNGDTSGWAVTQAPLFDTEFSYGNQMIRIWSFDADAQFSITQDAIHSNKPMKYADFFLNHTADCRYQAWNDGLASSNYMPMVYNHILFIASDNITYPLDYTGESIPSSNAWADLDGDGLIANQETIQGTLNTSKDTDSDGLSDYIESQWYPNRQPVFCGTSCAYPNPTQKDLYLQIDWMKNSSNQTFKPTSTQLSLVEDMYADKGINFHADTGQYGGGNELATYTHSLNRESTAGQVDFWDYKNGGDGITANFSSDRNLIWRYMIYGYEYSDPDFSGTSSGWSEVMGDDIFVSGGWIEDQSGLVSLDRAIANTLAHETGHALCLSDEQIFSEQPTECIYDGIDNDDANDPEHDLVNYKSVMNYRYQLTDVDDLGIVDYSDGSHGTGDFNDWGGALTGMDGFSGSKTVLGATITKPYYVTPDGGVVIDEAPAGVVEKEKNAMQAVQMDEESENKNDSTSNGSTSKLLGETPEKLHDEADNSSEDWTTAIASGVTATAVLTIGVIWLIKRDGN